MHYTKNYLGTNYMPSLITIPKSLIIPMFFDASIKGASAIKTIVGSAEHCKAYAETTSIDSKRTLCRRVYDTKNLIKDKYANLNFLKLNGASSDEIKTVEHELATAINLLNDLINKTCTGCPYAYPVQDTIRTKRYNFARFGSRHMSLSLTKLYMALLTLLPTSIDKEGDYAATNIIGYRTIHIEILKNASNLSGSAVRHALRELHKLGEIEYTKKSERGVYYISFTKKSFNNMTLTASEGGAGYMTLPSIAMQFIREITNIDVLKLVLLVFFAADMSIFDGNFEYKPYDGRIYFKTDMLKFLKLHRNGSLKATLEKFEKISLKYGGHDFISISSVFSSDGKYNDGRYERVRISMPAIYAPRQNNLFAHIKDDINLGRVLSADALTRVEYDLSKITGISEKYKQIYERFLPDKDGKIRKNAENTWHVPLNKEETLIPVLENIEHNFGSEYIFEAFRKSFIRFKNEIKDLCHFISSKHVDLNKIGKVPDQWNDTISKVSSYMYAVAREKYEYNISHHRRFEASAGM